MSPQKGSHRHLLTNVDLARHCGGDQRGAVFLEFGDGFLVLSDKSVDFVYLMVEVFGKDTLLV